MEIVSNIHVYNFHDGERGDPGKEGVSYRENLINGKEGIHCNISTSSAVSFKFDLSEEIRPQESVTIVAKVKKVSGKGGLIFVIVDNNKNYSFDLYSIHDNKTITIHFHNSSNTSIKSISCISNTTPGVNQFGSMIDIDWICAYKGNIDNPPLFYIPSFNELKGIDGKNGLDAPSLVPKGKWSPSGNYTSSRRFADLVFVGNNPDTAQWYACIKDNRGIKPPNNIYWESVGRTKWLVAASGIFGKISADQIEASAFNKKWKVLNEHYTSDDIYNLVKEGQNYYFILPKGDIKLPILGSSSQIPIGTEISFLLPDNNNAQKRYFTDSFPLRANFQDAGIIEGNLHIGAASIKNVCPIKSGVLHFQAVSGSYGYKWLWTNWAEFRNLDLLAKIRDVDGKAKRFLNSGSTSVDASKVSVIHCSDNLSYRTTLNLFNAHYGNDVTIVIPHWAMNGGNVSINLFEGKNSTNKCKCIDISESGVYKIHFWDSDGTGCYCAKLSDTFVDCKEVVLSDNVTPLPNDNPWELPGWWDDWKSNS